MNKWYFAYGSNLWIDQMVARTGPLRQGADRPQLARLPGYRLAFNMQGTDGQVFANLMQPGAFVLGVIYCCDLETLATMDGFEQGYERRRVSVVGDGGGTLEAVAYMSLPANIVRRGKPSIEYVQRIVRGGRQHGLPEAYLHEIEALAWAE